MEPTPGDYLTPALYAFGLIIAGVIIRHIRILKPITKPAFRILNVGILWVILPTVVFISIARYNLTQILGFGNALVLAFIGMGVCFVSAVALSHVAKDDRKTTIAITMNSAFMNVTYLGFPIVYALVGTSGLGPAALFAMGVGIPHLIFGITLASSAAEKRVTPGFVLENVVTFTATFALIVALLFIGFGAAVPDVARNTFDIYLTKPFFALMLLLVGYRMPIVNPRKYVGVLTTVGALRFLVCPLMIYLGILILGLNVGTDITPKPVLIQAVMPPAIFNLILASNYKLDLKLYGAMVFYLTFISLFVALPLMIHFVF